MNEKNLVAELTKNCKEKGAKAAEMLKIYDLACIGYDLQEQRCKDVHNRVLAENEFFCAREFSRDTGFKIGDRITDEDYLFLLSDDDFNKVMELTRPYLVAEKITDENGYFLENWAKVKHDAKEELVKCLVFELIPESLRHNFTSCFNSVVYSDKLIDVFRKSLKPVA